MGVPPMQDMVLQRLREAPPAKAWVPNMYAVELEKARRKRIPAERVDAALDAILHVEEGRPDFPLSCESAAAQALVWASLSFQAAKSNQFEDEADAFHRIVCLSDRCGEPAPQGIELQLRQAVRTRLIQEARRDGHPGVLCRRTDALRTVLRRLLAFPQSRASAVRATASAVGGSPWFRWVADELRFADRQLPEIPSDTSSYLGELAEPADAFPACRAAAQEASSAFEQAQAVLLELSAAAGPLGDHELAFRTHAAWLALHDQQAGHIEFGREAQTSVAWAAYARGCPAMDIGEDFRDWLTRAVASDADAPAVLAELASTAPRTLAAARREYPELTEMIDNE